MFESPFVANDPFVVCFLTEFVKALVASQPERQARVLAAKHVRLASGHLKATLPFVPQV